MLTGKAVISPMSLDRLTHFEMQNHDQNEPNCNGVYLRNNLPKIKDEAYAINLDKYISIGTHCIVLYVNDDNIT